MGMSGEQAYVLCKKMIKEKLVDTKEDNNLITYPLTEKSLLIKLSENENVKMNGFFYNSDIGAYCSFEGLYMAKEVSGEKIHFGFCEIRGVHESNYSSDYRMDWEDGDTWYKHENQNIYKTSINFFDGSVVLDKNYSYYVVRNGIVYYQLKVRTSDTMAHNINEVLPYSLFGDYIYNEKISKWEDEVFNSVLRIDGKGGIQVTCEKANTWVLFNGSYPMAY